MLYRLQPAFNSIAPVKGGLLQKQGTGGLRTWKGRIFMLEGPYLYYYGSERDTQPKGVIYLASCAVQHEVEVYMCVLAV